MFRWPLLVIGIVIVILSQIMKSDYKALPNEAEKIEIQKALEYISGNEKKYIEIAAGVDTSKVIYGTVVKKPFYTRMRTDRTYRLEDILNTNEFIGAYAGTVITAGQVLSGRSILLQTVSEDEDKNKEILRERVLANVNDGLWILSPLFKKNDLAGRETWLLKSRYEGGLVNFKDLISTVSDPKIENKLPEIIGFAQKEFGIYIPEDALVIIEGYGTGFTPKAYYPVNGSDHSIFLVADPASKPEELRSVKGILHPSPLSHYPGFPKLIGAPLRDRIATIVQEEAGSYNKRKEDDVKSTSLVGSVLIIIALLGFLRKRFKKARTA
jgi:hypothetical protein